MFVRHTNPRITLRPVSVEEESDGQARLQTASIVSAQGGCCDSCHRSGFLAAIVNYCKQALTVWRWLGLAAGVLLVLLVASLWARHPVPAAEFVQLTNDSFVKNADGWPPPVLDNPLLSDGTRLYFTADVARVPLVLLPLRFRSGAAKLHPSLWHCLLGVSHSRASPRMVPSFGGVL